MEGFEPVKKQGCFGGPQNSGPQNDAIFEGFRILRVARVGNFIRSLHVEICLKFLSTTEKKPTKNRHESFSFLQLFPPGLARWKVRALTVP